MTSNRSIESGHTEVTEVFWSPSINVLGIWEVDFPPKKQKETKHKLRAALAGRQARAEGRGVGVRGSCSEQQSRGLQIGVPEDLMKRRYQFSCGTAVL